jgi:eukaryotic-like serine/threonine-protein kinase
MTEQKHCPNCGEEIPGEAPGGLCPLCVMRGVIQPEEETDMPYGMSSMIEGPGITIGHYELLELIGEGGMGLVYLARQQAPIQREVALKVVKLGMDTRQVVSRFEAERQTLAMLEHPHIAHVFDAGTTETGRPYFVMEYVEGSSITKYSDEQRLSVEQRLELFQQVCEAVHFAHQKGIIHRDLKPSNILVTTQGNKAVPKIIDFGIAKAVIEPLTGETSFTVHGQLLGTPEYMSPEQADLAVTDIDTRTDIYSLGVLLYELLAGVPPFDAKQLRQGGLDHIQQVIREQEPRTPSACLTSMGAKAKTVAERRRTQIVPLTRRLQRELEWIPMKAMRKDRARRYRSASELSDDIQNYMTGVPLIAGPESNVYRAKKFVRKHGGSVTSVALVAVVIVIGFITSTAYSISAEKAREKEVVARTQAEEARDKEAALRARAEKAEAIAKERNEAYRRSLYAYSIQLADAKYREGNVGDARKLLKSCPEDLRGWEWDRVNNLLDHSVISLSERANSIALNPDGERLISGGRNGAIRVWDITTGKELSTFPGAHTGSINRVQFSPDGKRIASCDSSGEIKVWDAADVNTPITSIQHGSSWIPRVSFSPDGNRIVSASNADGTIKVWDVTTGTERLTFDKLKAGTKQGGGIRFVGFNPNGKHIVSAEGDGIITTWDAVSGDKVMSFAAHDQEIRTMSFNSDGSLFAVGCSNTVKILNAVTGSLVEILYGHDGLIQAVAFSPDDNYVISGSLDSTVRIWDAATGEEIRNHRGHEMLVRSVGFTPDGKRAISLAGDGRIKVWDVQVDREIYRFLGHKSLVASAAFSPDGKRLVTKSEDGIVKVWDLTNFAEVMTFDTGSEGILCHMALSPDGKRIASPNKARAIVVRDVETRDEVITLGSQADKVICLAYSPDGKHIVSGGSQGKLKQLKLWDVNNGEEVMTFSEVDSAILSVAFSPDGKQVVSGQVDGEVKLWDVASGAELQSLIGHGRIILSVAFSPDGKFIASACQNDKTARIWDAQSGQELKTLRGHGDILISVAYSPDGRRLITGSRDGTARVWDSLTGEELLTLRAGSPVTDVVFSPDGKSIAGCTFGGSIVLWDSASTADRYLAALLGDLTNEKGLIQEGFDADKKDEWGRTALYWAVLANQKEVAEFLIANGADVNAKVEKGRSLLFMAVKDNQKELAEILIAKGADINAKGDKSGATPLYCAVWNDHVDMVKLLLAKGADVNVADHSGWTPLHEAAWYGNLAITELLLANGAEINVKAKTGRTALDVARKRKHTEIVELLKKHGAK